MEVNKGMGIVKMSQNG